MAEATFRHGEPEVVEYTAAADLDAGAVVILGNTAGLCCGITRHAIANTEQGSIAIGGGCYDVINLNNAANWAKVYWDNSAKKVTTVSTNNALFGFIVFGGAAGANTTCKAVHRPEV